MPDDTATFEAAAQTVAAAWAEALGVPDVDRDEGFFDLGADSFAVMRVVGRLRGEWPAIKVVDVFANPTVNALARHLAERR